MGELNELALFAGAGGGILGGKLLGWRTVCAVEIQPYPVSVLIQRQNDGILPPFPIWDDVCTFDGRPWRGIVDVVSGGFPCQDISIGGNGAGITGSRSGLWGEMARIVGEVRPPLVFVENSPLLRNRGLDRVLSDLSKIRYDAEWLCLGASSVGAVHTRERFWLLAWDSDSRDAVGEKLGGRPDLLPTFGALAQEEQERTNGISELLSRTGIAGDITYSGVVRAAHAIPDRVDRLKALGNAQVPLVAATAWSLLTKRLQKVTRL